MSSQKRALWIIMCSRGRKKAHDSTCALPWRSIYAERFSGTAGRTSSLSHTGTPFSTKDRDNDGCTCKCAQLASGGASPTAAHLGVACHELTFNSFQLLCPSVQAGGLRRAVLPTSTAFTTRAWPAQRTTTASSGTTGRGPTWWPPEQPWWCDQPTSDGSASPGKENDATRGYFSI